MLGRSHVTAAPARLPQQRGDLTAQLAAGMQLADRSQLVAQAPRTFACAGRVIGQARAARGTDSAAMAIAFPFAAGGATGLLQDAHYLRPPALRTCIAMHAPRFLSPSVPSADRNRVV